LYIQWRKKDFNIFKELKFYFFPTFCVRAVL
jgi:hypothetical protein